MTTFRDLLLINHSNYEANNHSSLDEWFSDILDVPLENLSVGDLARAIRQDLFLAEMLQKAEIILKQDPLAGEDYDGQLISSIATLTSDEIKEILPSLIKIADFLNQLDKTNFDNKIAMDIEKIDKLSRS